MELIAAFILGALVFSIIRDHPLRIQIEHKQDLPPMADLEKMMDDSGQDELAEAINDINEKMREVFGDVS